MNTRRLIAFVVMSVGFAIGCGGRDTVSTVPVKGKVTCNGQPVKGGTINFSPAGEGRGAFGEIQSDGSFELTTYSTGDGAMPGKHSVTLTPEESENGESKATPCSDATIEIEIPADGTDSLTVELK